MTHERALTTDKHGQPYCVHCGLLEAQWPLSNCDGKPILSIVPPVEDTTDVYVSVEEDRFMFDPLAWIEEWNKVNGKVECIVTDKGFAACLWVEGVTEHPLSTGIAPTLALAFQYAIKGLDGLTLMR